MIAASREMSDEPKNLLSPDGAWLKSGIVRTMARAWASRMQAGKPDGVRARQRVA